MIRKSLVASIMVFACAVLCLAADFNGRWEGKVTGPQGDLALTFNFKVDGDKLTGSVESQMGEVAISEGKVKGDEITFNVVFGDTTITHQGKLAGETIHIKSHGPWGDVEYDLKHAAKK